MAATQKKIDLFSTDEGRLIELELRAMAADSGYTTEASYSTDSAAYPDNRMPFVDKHMQYLRTHPATDPRQYLSNLRLMTRVR